jgi:hypothetical protein
MASVSAFLKSEELCRISSDEAPPTFSLKIKVSFYSTTFIKTQREGEIWKDSRTRGVEESSEIKNEYRTRNIELRSEALRYWKVAAPKI